MFQGNVHEFLDKILEELKKNRDLVIEQDGESVTVRHRGDPISSVGTNLRFWKTSGSTSNG